MAKLIKGDIIAKQIFEEIKAEVATLSRKPILAVLLVGDSFASASYVKGKSKAGEKVGIDVKVFAYPNDVLEETLIKKIKTLNTDCNIDGIIVQLPLPKHLNESKIINCVKSSKDVDGFTFYNAGRLFKGQPHFEPCTPKGILRMLKEEDIDVTGKNAVVVGRSNLVGLPLSRMLIEANATVTTCHSRTKNLKKITKTADILFVAIGQKNFIDASFIKEGAIIIDVGINRDDNNKLTGDVDFEDVFNKASLITPVPKGVGPLTISMLLSNTLTAHKGEFYE